MNDKVLRQSIIDALDFDPSIDAARIGVAVDNGIVTLSGHVGSYAEKIAAETLARRIKGVRAIAEEIEVRYPDHKKTADDQIASRAVSVISWDAMVPEGVVKVKVEKGWVTLAGTVDWQFQREAAYRAVRKLSGVLGITNSIEVKARVQIPDVQAKILAALKRDAEFEADGIKVNVIGDKVILDGKIKAWHERQVAERAAWSAAGVRSVEDNLHVA
ncbi:BON domain-containing protein [Labrys portucalensis]|uniref:BON domain-containing protein n=1 Tax=Labrys neptuniae TaxID=376174 RepID=A0ABV6ZR84_9HYPH|nr:BON domain-containing protein [Labrys neptuniae]MDT3379661.1 BON domain-containing protein [Labrys neptuniae]